MNVEANPVVYYQRDLIREETTTRYQSCLSL
jgi:hypothetical protein